MSDAPVEGRSWSGIALRAVVPLVGAAVVMAGIIWLGSLVKQHLGKTDRVRFGAIECDTPPGMTGAEFLEQVQAQALLPDELPVGDDLLKKLFTAFALHPWVAEVQKIERLPGPRVRVRLRFRTPVLAVECGGKTRVVDENGILLPETSTAGLEVIHESTPPTLTGRTWCDRVTAAAKKTALAKAP